MIRQKVMQIVSDFKSNDPYVIAEKSNIHLVAKQFDKRVKGVYISTGKEVVIGINTLFNEYQKKIILAHELGHHFLHNDNINLLTSSNLFPRSSIKELEANKFASELLIQDIKVDKKFIESLSRFERKKIMQYKVVSDDDFFYLLYEYFIKVG